MNSGMTAILPELILAASALAVILVRSIRRNEVKLHASIAAAAGGAGALGALVFFTDYRSTISVFHEALNFDPLSWFFRAFFCGLFLLILFFSLYSKELHDYLFAEYLFLVMTATVAMSFLSASTNLLMIYITIETVSITSYLLTGFIAGRPGASEASLKYIVFGSVSSAVMLFGISYLYGLTGTLNIDRLLPLYIANFDNPLFLQFALGLVTVGFAFKIALVPLHFWSPDVYQEAPTPVAAFFSVGPKAAGFAVFIRIFYDSFASAGESLNALASQITDKFSIIFAVLAAVTMTAGNLMALRQTNLKRLLAYSSIAHSGFMFMGVLVFSSSGIRALVFSLFAYLLMNIGAFIIVMLVSDRRQSADISSFKGLGWQGGSGTLLAVLFAVFLFSLAGLPPLAGFIGKWYIFAAVVEQEMLPLIIIALLNTVIGLYYYARIIRTLFLEGDNSTPQSILNLPRGPLAVLSIMAALTLFFGIFFSGFFEYLIKIVP